MIRRASKQDYPKLLDLLEQMRAETRYVEFDFDPPRIIKTLDMVRERGVLLVDISKDGDVNGGIALVVQQHPLVPITQAIDLFVYVKPDLRGTSLGDQLISSANRWRISKGVDELILGISTGVNSETISRYYENIGVPKLGYLHKVA